MADEQGEWTTYVCVAAAGRSTLATTVGHIKFNEIFPLKTLHLAT